MRQVDPLMQQKEKQKGEEGEREREREKKKITKVTDIPKKSKPKFQKLLRRNDLFQ